DGREKRLGLPAYLLQDVGGVDGILEMPGDQQRFGTGGMSGAYAFLDIHLARCEQSRLHHVQTESFSPVLAACQDAARERLLAGYDGNVFNAMPDQQLQ